MSQLWGLLGSPIALHRRLFDITGSIKAALLLSQAIYWTRHGIGIKESDGWFFKTSAQWSRETGISRYEQARARARLQVLGLLEERLRGLPAKLHFRVNGAGLATRVSAMLGTPCSRFAWDDGARLLRLLGPIIPFHGCLVTAGLGVSAAVLLSRSLYRARAQLLRAESGWFRASTDRWDLGDGFSRARYEGARRTLRQANLINESYRGIPPRLWLKVDSTNLMKFLGRGDCASKTARHTPPVCGNPTYSGAENCKTRMREFHNQYGLKPENLFPRNQQYSFEVSSTLYKKLITSTLSTPPQPEAPQDNGLADTIAGGGDEWVFPAGLLPQERAIARSLVMGTPNIAQPLLDELAARMEARDIRGSPIAYLRGLLKRARSGTFVADQGLRVAARRKEEAARSREMLGQAKQGDDALLERASPEHRARIEARRADIRTMLALLATQRTCK